MARLRGHRTLNAEQPLYVRRAVLTINGATFAAGDALPWQALGVTPRKLHQLWHARVVAHERADERNGAENPVELVSPIQFPPAPTALPAVTVQPDTSTPPGFTAGGSIVVATTSDDRALLATDSQRAVFKVALGETVPVPPSQPTGRHKRR